MLSPLALDPARPFPKVLNKSLNFAIVVEGEDGFGRNSGLAVVQAPRSLPRLVRLPDELGNQHFVFLGTIVEAFVAKLFAGISSRLNYRLEAGPSSTFLTAPSGPYDQRLGYSLMPSMLSHAENSYSISYQASSSAGLHNLLKIGSYPIYPEKSGAGLVIFDRNNQPLFEARSWGHFY